MSIFWRLFPLIIELVRHGGQAIVERYRAKRAEEERKKEELDNDKETPDVPRRGD